MSDFKVYAAFNSLSVTGRVFNAELASYQDSEFLAVTLITNLADEDDGCTVTFNMPADSQLAGLFNKGYLPNGRMMTVTGHIKSVSETYTDKDGDLIVRTRPQIHLVGASVPSGALGALPSKDRKTARPAKGTKVMRPSDANLKAPKKPAAAVDAAPAI